MKRKRNGLGRLLLTQFKKSRNKQAETQKKKTRSQQRSVSRFASPSRKILRFSQFYQAEEDSDLESRAEGVDSEESRQHQPSISPEVKTKETSEIKPETTPDIKIEIKPAEVLVIRPEIKAEAQLELQLTPPQISIPQVQQIPTPWIEKGGASLSTQDLVRPNDRLKQSIEAFLLDQRSPHTRRAYGKDLKRFVKFLLSRNFQQGVESLNRMVLISYKESLLSEGLEHTTVDRHLATLRSFFKWLVDDGVLPKSPADGVRFLNPKRISRTNGFTDEEVRKLLSLPDLHTRTGSLHYAILMVLFYCGLRRSELCDLMTTSLGKEREHRVLRLRGKGNSERVIVVVPPVWNAIRHYFYITQRDFEKNEPLFCPVRNNRTGELNKSLDPSMIFYIVKKYSKEAGMTIRVSPHSCRATAISNARDHNIPDRAIQEFAGWTSPDMITRYDKRKSAIINSAAHGISYGADERSVPVSSKVTETLSE